MRKFPIEIASPDGIEFSGEIESLLVHTDDGDAEILAGHADFLASLPVGRARLRVDSKDLFASVSGGFLSVVDGKARMAVTTFEFAGDIDLARAKEAKERAEEQMSKAKSDTELRILKAKLARASNRISIAEYK